MTVKRYNELKDLASHQKFDGIEYVFGKEQYKKYLEKHNYTDESLIEAIRTGKLVTDGFGGIGTPMAFEARDNYYRQLNEQIKTECTGDDIFEAEWWNHECGLTYDIQAPLILARNIFPSYKPSPGLLNRLNKEFNALN